MFKSLKILTTFEIGVTPGLELLKIGIAGHLLLVAFLVRRRNVYIRVKCPVTLYYYVAVTKSMFGENFTTFMFTK